MIKVGEKLKEARKRKGLTLEQVAKATKIRESFLQAIEEGQYDMLPGASYVQGFVKNYLEFMNFPAREYMALFRREYDENEHRKLIPEGLVRKEIPLKRFSIKQTAVLLLAVVLALFAYLLFQYRGAIWNPGLTISSPKEAETATSRMVMVSGKADPNTTVTINNLPAYVTPDGSFSKEIPVFPGAVTFVVKAMNTFGKITVMERHITVAQGS